MTQAFDERIVRVGLEINGEIVIFEGLDIRVSGRKYLGPELNECTVKISNLSRDQRNYILTKASPIKFRPEGPQAVNMFVDVGRKSYGTFRLFQGGVLATGATQPPDIGIFLQSLNNNFATSIIGMNSLGPTVSLRSVAESIAKQNNLTLEYNVAPENNKLIANYSFTGSLAKQVVKLAEAGNVDVTYDNDTLIVLDKKRYRKDARYLIAQDTGMVGVPQLNEQGCVVTILANPSIEIGTGVVVNSVINPAADGEYKVVQINFNIANRDNPFFYTLVCSSNPRDQGASGG